MATWKVDKLASAAYLWLVPERGKGCVARTIATHHRDILLDIGHDGVLLGVEVLDLSLLPQEPDNAV